MKTLPILGALALVLFGGPALSSEPRNLSKPPERGEGMEVIYAPENLSDKPDIVSVGHGLVWLRLHTGEVSSGATKVGRGYFITEAGFRNLDLSVAKELSALQETTASLKLELSTAYSRLSLYEGTQPEVDLKSPDCKPQTVVVGEQKGFGFKAILIGVGVGLVVGAGGTYYLLHR